MLIYEGVGGLGSPIPLIMFFSNIALTIGIALTILVTSFAQTALAHCAAFRQMTKLRVAVLKKILHLDMEWHDREETSQLYSRLIE